MALVGLSTSSDESTLQSGDLTMRRIQEECSSVVDGADMSEWQDVRVQNFLEPVWVNNLEGLPVMGTDVLLLGNMHTGESQHVLRVVGVSPLQRNNVLAGPLLCREYSRKTYVDRVARLWERHLGCL